MDRSKTLEELDGQRWGDPPADSTGLIDNVHRLRQIPLREMTDDDIRELLLQNVGSDWLVEVALDRLADDPMAGDLYPGDLLHAVLQTEAGYWDSHPDQLMRLWDVRQTLAALENDVRKVLGDDSWPAFG